MADVHIVNQIIKLLERQKISISKVEKTSEEFIINVTISNGDASYFIKGIDANKVMIGANVEFNVSILTPKVVAAIQDLVFNFNVLSEPTDDSEDAEFQNLAIKMVYMFSKFNGKDFLLYLEQFKGCIEEVYVLVEGQVIKSLNELYFTDVTMLDGLNLEDFEPSEYVARRDASHSGSWEEYIDYLSTNNLNEELEIVKRCKDFEDTNGMPIDMLDDITVEALIEYTYKNKEGTN